MVCERKWAKERESGVASERLRERGTRNGGSALARGLNTCLLIHVTCMHHILVQNSVHAHTFMGVVSNV